MNFQRSWYLICIAGLLVSCQRDLPVPDTTEARINRILRANLALGGAPGYAVGTIRNGQQSLYFAGTQNVNTGKPFDRNTVGEIGSITKTFTAFLLADLVNQGVISLDDSVNKYMPADLKLPSKSGVSVKIKHLLNHTSGLPRIPDDLPATLDDPYSTYSVSKMGAYLKRVTLDSTPGTTFEYSNTAVGLAGFLVARLTGKSYQQNIREKIMQPLGMQATFINQADTPVSNVAQGYNAGKPLGFWEFTEVLEAAGGIKSTVNDMLLYLNAFMNSPATSDLGKGFAQTRQPTFTIASNMAIGLNWIIDNRTTDPIYWHNGGTGGFSSYLACIPGKKTGVFVFSNGSSVSSNTDVIGRAIMAELVKN